jgi:hypothetical protein
MTTQTEQLDYIEQKLNELDLDVKPGKLAVELHVRLDKINRQGVEPELAERFKVLLDRLLVEGFKLQPHKTVTYEVRDHDTEIDPNTDEPLRVLYRCENGEPVEEIGTDGGEPEDNSFARDWSWVAPALQAAYELGRRG